MDEATPERPKYARKPVDADLLDEFVKAAGLLCKWAAQVDEWGLETRFAIERAKKAGVSVDVIHDVLVRQGKADVPHVKTIRQHYTGTCRCPKRRP